MSKDWKRKKTLGIIGLFLVLVTIIFSSLQVIS